MPMGRASSRRRGADCHSCCSVWKELECVASSVLIALLVVIATAPGVASSTVTVAMTVSCLHQSFATVQIIPCRLFDRVDARCSIHTSHKLRLTSRTRVLRARCRTTYELRCNSSHELAGREPSPAPPRHDHSSACHARVSAARGHWPWQHQKFLSHQASVGRNVRARLCGASACSSNV